MLILVSYDITDDRRRAKLARLLDDYGDRVQYSVFEAWLSSKELEEMVKKARDTINEKEDSVRIYQICRSCQQQLILLGQTESSAVRDAYVL